MLDLAQEAYVAVGAASERARDYFTDEHPWFQALVLATFATFNSIRVVAYVPQIVKAARDTNGASAISYTTWGLFLASHLTTICYAIVFLGDPLLAVIFLGNAFACFAVLLVTFHKRRAHKKFHAVGQAGERW